MRSLNDTNEIDSDDPERHGAIQIQQIVDDGQERYIVYIPGTDDMGPIPQDGEHARDMETNYQLIGGMDSAYGHGIQQAMIDAGLEGKDVMLVGHSQGGMVSTSLAADPDFNRHFNVQHVVTAGSPTAQVPDLPSGTSAIHFENRGDAVPLLDGEDNPDEPNRTTVKFDEGTTDIADNHAIRPLHQRRGGGGRVDQRVHPGPDPADAAGWLPRQRNRRGRLDLPDHQRMTRMVRPTIVMALIGVLMTSACSSSDGSPSGSGSTAEEGCGECTQEVAEIREQLGKVDGIRELVTLTRYPSTPTNGAGVKVELRSTGAGDTGVQDEVAEIVWKSRVTPLDELFVTVEDSEGELVQTLPYDFHEGNRGHAAYVEQWGPRPVQE